MTVRTMVVVRSPGTDATPMLKVANRLPQVYGFDIGAAIEVTYQPGIINVRLIDTNHADSIQTPPLVSRGTKAKLIRHTADRPSGAGADTAALGLLPAGYISRGGYGYACPVQARAGAHSLPMHD